MKPVRLLLAALAAMLPFALPAAAPKHAPAKIGAADWTRTVNRTPAGAYILGNPAARVKLIEYFSLTCPHCAHFSAESAAPLGAMIKAGTVSLEMRHALRDGTDLAASVAARCAGPAYYFESIAAVFAKQEEWGAKAEEYEQANGAALNKMARGDALAAVARGAGIEALLVPHGLIPAKLPACAASKPEQKALADMAAEAWGKRKIPGTPAFLINGKLQADVASWDALVPRLQAALR